MPSPSPGKILPDRLQNAGPGEPVEVWIYTAFQKDGWVARKGGDQTRADHPGTAIRVGDDLLEIIVVEAAGEAGYTVRYGLRKWEPQHAVRKVIPFNAQTQAEAAVDYLEEQHRKTLRQRILWLFPLAGLAPDPLQREWEKETGLNMSVISAVSAVTMAIVFLTLAGVFGRSPENQVRQPILAFLAIESFIRLLWIVLSQKPHGTVLLTFPYLLWEAVAHPEKRRQKKEAQLHFSYEGDEIIRRPGSNVPLVVRSMLFDDLLAGPNPMRFEDVVYRPVHWFEEGIGLEHRIVYEFEKIDVDPAAAKTKFREYTQPRTPERQRVVEAFTRNRDRVKILAPLWGTYPRDEQLRLEARYHFPAAHWTAITAGLLFLGALLEAWAAVLFHMTIFALAGPVYLTAESFYRLYQAKVRGVPAASVAGYLAGLLFRPPQ